MHAIIAFLKKHLVDVAFPYKILFLKRFGRRRLYHSICILKEQNPIVYLRADDERSRRMCP
jgi:hypothetical protein